MEIAINKPVTDRFILNEGYVFRNDFVFVRGDHKSNIFDRLVIRTPQRTRSHDRRQGFSSKSLIEHIELVNRLQIRKALIYCDDLSFLTRCPCVQDVMISPSYDADAEFDYSPLYQMPDIQNLSCITVYGDDEQYTTKIDYSRLPNLQAVTLHGNGHVGYETLTNLQNLQMTCVKRHKSFTSLSSSKVLKHAEFTQCGLQSLNGIGQHKILSKLVLYNNNSLKDISNLPEVADSLTELVIENCSKIKDFSVLEHLVHLKHLQLGGNNVLPDLQFLRKMPELKTFTFSMNVEDGDLRPCLDLPYASCRNRKHYNLKDEQLPKNLA